MRLLNTLLFSGVFTIGLYANRIGVSSHPFTMNKNVLTTEFNSITSQGIGQGITSKFFKRLSYRSNFDIGVGISDGDRANRFFTGLDYELYPDYAKQPRISVKSFFESENVLGQRLNSLGFAPTISKGLRVRGHEVFPFMALPFAVTLNDSSRTYETSQALSAGFTTRLPFVGFEKIVGSFETNMNIRNSFTSFLFGVSLPLQ